VPAPSYRQYQARIFVFGKQADEECLERIKRSTTMLPIALIVQQSGQDPVTTVREASGAMVVLFILFLGGYFVPSIVALVKKKRNTGAIVLVNVLLGWTVIGWIVALVWAVTNDVPVVQVNQNYYGQPTPQAGSVGDRFCQRCGAHFDSRGICPRCTPALA
jgi:hypothetical protein